VTFIELIIALAIGGTILVGLGLVYAFGINTWQSTEKKIRLQQNASFAIAEISGALQGAETVEMRNQEIVVRYPEGPDVVFRRSGKRLFKDGKMIIPFMAGNHQVELIDLEINFKQTEQVFKLRLNLGIEHRGYQEVMDFETSIYPRNLSVVISN